MNWIVFLLAAFDTTTCGFHVSSRSRKLLKLKTASLEEPAVVEKESEYIPMRSSLNLDWGDISDQLESKFGYSSEAISEYKNSLSKNDLLELYKSLEYFRGFENSCNQQYMQGKIRGFMHLDNGQESIPTFVKGCIRQGDLKYSYYREHTHALASGVDGGKIMAELMMKEAGTCKGSGGSMHIFDKENYFQGGWALVAEQLPYACGAAKSILLDRILGLRNDDKQNKQVSNAEDDRICIVFVGEGGAQNGRFTELLNSASKDNLPLLVVVIDNGRAINTFTPDVAQNSNVYEAGERYGVPGLLVDGRNAVDVFKAGKAVTDYVRNKGPAILQVHTYRFMGHSPADPEHERGRKEEKVWARQEQDPIKVFEQLGLFTESELKEARKEVLATVKSHVKFAEQSKQPPKSLAKELEYPDTVDTDYNLKKSPSFTSQINSETINQKQNSIIQDHIEKLRLLAKQGSITIADAINLAVHEEMLRDPTTTMHAEDLQAGSSYDIPKLTQQTYGRRAADEIIDEGHFIGKALGEAMNGYRPIVELMNANFGIYGMPEISSAGNTYATTGGQFHMPMTIIGAGGTAPSQSLGAEHSQPFHAYVMGIPGLKIQTAASPEAAYGLTKSAIRDNGPCFLFAPVKMMKDTKGFLKLDQCLDLHKAAVIHSASPQAIQNNKAVTVLTYLHGVRESLSILDSLKEEGMDIDLIELRSLKPLDLKTIQTSLEKTHKLAILDESTKSGGVGATLSALVNEELFDLLDAPVRRLAMDDAPVPYATTMEEAVVKRGSDLLQAVFDLCTNKI